MRRSVSCVSCFFFLSTLLGNWIKHTLQAIIARHLVHHGLVLAVLQAVCPTRMEQVMRHAVAGVCVQSYTCIQSDVVLSIPRVRLQTNRSVSTLAITVLACMLLNGSGALTKTSWALLPARVHRSTKMCDRSWMPARAGPRMMLLLAYRSAISLFLLACYHTVSLLSFFEDMLPTAFPERKKNTGNGNTHRP